MSSIQAHEVQPGMFLERLDYVGDSSSPGKPRYMRATVVSIEPVDIYVDPWFRIEWSGGAKGVYAPHQRFIIVPDLSDY